jgi:flagellar basal-body rod modification protein FlgD
MSTITDNNALNVIPDNLSGYSAAARQTETQSENDLGEDAFLTLMLAQLKHQDPMQPMENGEFLSQMAEFSTVTGIEDMNASLETLTTSIGTNRTLEAASLIGREVVVEDDQLSLDDSDTGVGGRFSLDSSSGDVSLDIYSPDGTLVRRQAMGQFEAGEHAFSWDGLTDNGEAAPAGDYTASISADNGIGERYAVPVLVMRTVDSVELGTSGSVILNTQSGDSIGLDEVRQIREAKTHTSANTNNTEEETPA